jgi:hypothetical protein
MTAMPIAAAIIKRVYRKYTWKSNVKILIVTKTDLTFPLRQKIWLEGSHLEIGTQH